MSVARLEIQPKLGKGMDRAIMPNLWMRWPLGIRIATAGLGTIAFLLTTVALIVGDARRTMRVPATQLTIATVEQGVFHDLIPLRAKVVPRDTIYLDAIEGGRIDRVLVEPGEVVNKGQRLIELGNTNLQLQVIQEESQVNQAISQLQQNEIVLEQSKIANDKALAQIDYDVIRLSRSFERRNELAAKGVTALEQRDVVQDELNHNRAIRPMQAASNARQEELRARLLPEIHDQLDRLAHNLEVVRAKLDNLVVRSPVTGRVTDLDLKVGENRSPGQRLAEITPDTGYKLSADVDEFYIASIRLGQHAQMETNEHTVGVHVIRIYPQVKDGHFIVDLAFDNDDPPGLVSGQAMQGRLALGGDQPALVIPAGAFLERTGGNWIFVFKDDTKADHRLIKAGRRNAEQVEISGGLKAGERVIVSDYTGYERTDRIVLTK